MLCLFSLLHIQLSAVSAGLARPATGGHAPPARGWWPTSRVPLKMHGAKRKVPGLSVAAVGGDGDGTDGAAGPPLSKRRAVSSAPAVSAPTHLFPPEAGDMAWTGSTAQATVSACGGGGFFPLFFSHMRFFSFFRTR